MAEYTRGEHERANRDRRSERREWQGSAASPQREGHCREAGQTEDWSRDAEWEPRRPPRYLEPWGGREAGLAQRERGGLPAPTPELGRIAATWATGQAAERNQWALELWKVTEEKRAALVALLWSEETLHQVWRQLRPPWPGPPIAVPPAGPQQEGTPGSRAAGRREVKR